MSDQEGSGVMKILVDLHTHTIASGHAFSTLKENIDEAKKKGLRILGTSDHANSMPGAPDDFFFENYKIINEEINSVRILKGIEANILDYEGKIDVQGKMRQAVDYVIASLHSHCIESGSKEENTDAIIGAMDNPVVKIIGHPDDGRFPLNYERLVKAAKKTGVILELNNASLMKSSARENTENNMLTLIKLIKKNDMPIILGSDSHIYYNVGRFDEIMKLIQAQGLPEELIMNCNIKQIEALADK